jgi:HAD superfamily hydrolase (TIGR01549 family)
MRVSAVVFDVGEVLIDETGVWSRWADWLGVPRLTFMALLGAEIAAGRSYGDVFPHFRADFDLEAEQAARMAAGDGDPFVADDLYPDAREALEGLARAGYRLAIAGNQPEAAEAILGALELPVELIAASERWGVHKPEPAFFARVAAELGLATAAIAYVGDRLDNDVLPARAAGMVSVFLKRGPWGHIHAARPEAALAAIRIRSLSELEPKLAAWNRDHAGEGGDIT